MMLEIDVRSKSVSRQLSLQHGTKKILLEENETRNRIVLGICAEN